jgi:tape measure domain-containing protein
MAIGAETVKRLGVEVIGDTSDAERKLDKLGDSASSGSGWGKRLAIGAGAAFAAIGAGAVAAGGWGLKIAAEGEMAAISFETMLGSGEKAASFLAELKAFAATTPFEFPELQTAASSLISAGFEASQVIPIMTTLGDVTSGMGTGAEGVQRATVALQQMSAAGRITGEDLNQLRDAGIPVFDLLAGATGKSKEEISALAQAGKLGKDEMNQLFAALETGGGGLERFHGLMEKQSQSLTGMVSTLKDTVGQQLSTMMAPAVDTLKSELPALTEFIGESLGEIGPEVRTAFGGVLEILKGLLPAVTPIIGGVLEAFGTIASALGPALAELGPAIAEIARPIAGELGTAVATVLPPMLDIFKALLPVLPSLVKSFARLAPPLAVVAEAAADLLGIIPPDVLASLVIGFLAFDKAGKVMQGFGSVMDGLGKASKGNPWILAITAIAVLAPLIIENWGPISDFFIALWDTVGGVFTGAWDAIKGVVEGGISWILDHLGDFGRIAIGVMTGGLSELALFLWNHWEDIKNGVVTGFWAIIDFITGLPAQIANAASGMWDGITNAFRDALNWLIDLWNGLEFEIPGFDTPIGSWGGFTLGVPDIPHIAAGAITRGPTLAVIGDNRSGIEAVVPLERAEEFGFGSSSSAPAAPTVVHVTLELDGKVLAKGVIDPLRGLLVQKGATNVGGALAALGG